MTGEEIEVVLSDYSDCLSGLIVEVRGRLAKVAVKHNQRNCER